MLKLFLTTALVCALSLGALANQEYDQCMNSTGAAARQRGTTPSASDWDYCQRYISPADCVQNAFENARAQGTTPTAYEIEQCH